MNIKKMRALKGFNQQKVANYLGVSKAYISQVENDKNHDLPLKHAEKMAELFECSLVELYGIDILRVEPENDKEVILVLKSILDVYVDPLKRKEILEKVKGEYL